MLRFGSFWSSLFFDDDGAGGAPSPKAAFDAAIDAASAKYADAPPPEPPAPAAAPVVPEPPAPAAPEAATPPADPFPDPDAIPEDLRYRDAKELREQVAAARRDWKPIADALGGIPEADRAVLAQVAPALGEDLGLIMQGFSGLNVADRRELAKIAHTLATGTLDQRAAVADELAAAAARIRGDEVDPAAVGLDDDDLDDDDDPLVTRSELDRWAETREQERQQQAAVEAAHKQILDEARGLGYDPESTDPVEIARYAGLIEVAKRDPDGNLQRAHEALAARDRKLIDDYVAGKTADAARPGSPDSGGSPTQARSLETMDDAEAAARARVDAMFGSR